MKPLLVVLILGTVVPTVGAEPITLTVTPRVLTGYRSGQVRADWRIEPQADNRWTSLAWGSDDGETGSWIEPVDGASGAIRYSKYLTLTKAHPEIRAQYNVEACVYAVNPSRKHCARQTVEVA